MLPVGDVGHLFRVARWSIMKTNARPSISVVIPCYMSAGFLEDLVYEVEKEVSQITDAYEVVLVVDGSPDNTWQVAQSLAGERVRALKLSRNFGQHNALLAGIREAKHEVIVTMDDDFQHRPSEIGLLVDELSKGFDLVFGVPNRGAHGHVRNRFSKWLKGFLAVFAGVQMARDMGAFRAFRSSLRRGLTQITGPNVALNVALGWTTTNIGRVEINLDARKDGKSGYTTRALVRQAVNLILGYSVLPLRLVAIGGFALALIGAAIFVFEIWANLTGRVTVPGFTTVVATVVMFSGAQLLGIAVVGEYLARMYTQSIGVPSYVIAEETD